MRVSRRTIHLSALGLVLACTLHPAGHAQVPTQYESLTLDRAIALGLEHYPSADMAAAKESLARAAVAKARTMLFPTVTASEQAIVSTDPVFAFGTKLRQARFTSADFSLDNLNHPSAIGNFDSSATAQWTAFDSFATKRRIQSAREAVSAAELNRRFTDLEITASITTLYYRALLAEAQVGVAEANLTRAQEIAADIRDRVHSGLALEADSMKADLAVRNADDDLSSTKSNVRVAREDLFAAMGQQPTDAALIVPEAASPTTARGSTAPLSARLDLQALDLEKMSAQHNLSSIRASAGPKLSTYANVESNNPHLTGGGSGNWTVGAKLEISVFDGGVRKASEQEAAAQVARIAAAKSQTELEANNRIRSLKAQIDDLERRHETAEAAIRADEESLKASRDRYAAGLVAVSEVLSDEAALSAAEFERLRSAYELRIASSQLQFAAGTLTTPKTGNP